MPFNALLIDSLYNGNVLKEGNSGVLVRREAFDKTDETVLIFKSDENDSFFREKWIKKAQRDKTGDEPKCCDWIIFYHKIETPERRKEKRTNNEPFVTVCFVELKSDDFPDALKQIQNTYTIVRGKLIEDSIPQEKINWKAVIVSTSSLLKKDNKK